MLVPILVLTIIAPAGSQTGRGQGPGIAGSGPVLGFSNCSPVLLRALPTSELAISISQIGYDSFGRATTFVEEIRGAGAPTQSKVTVLQDPDGNCPKIEYTVETGGRRLTSTTEAEFKAEGLDGYFSFSSKDIGGIVVIGPLEGGLQTGLSYDSFGRRQLADQKFTYAARRYEVTYSDVTFDGFGRLSSYRAVIKPSAQ